jgi:hypothetical protein
VDGPDLAGLRRQLVDVVRQATGLEGVEPYAPDAVNGLTAYFGDAVAEVTMGASEAWSWTLPLTLAVPRHARYWDEQTTLEALVPRVMAAVRANYSQNGTMGIPVTRFTQGTAGPEGARFAAITFWFSPKQKFAATLD